MLFSVLWYVCLRASLLFWLFGFDYLVACWLVDCVLLV